jgi:imidazolonepropionase-like amidohydrolase
MARYTPPFFALAVAACAAAPAPAPPLPPSQVAPSASPVASGAPQPSDRAPTTTRTALLHVTVVDPSNGTETADRAVVFEGDRIVAVVASDALPATPPTRTIDGRGKFVIPGLWDMHVHFSDPPSPPLFIANGVTGVRVMWGNPQFGPKPERFHHEWRDAFDRKEQVGPRMVIASNIMDGPHPIWPNSLALASPEEGRKAVDDAKADGADFIKVYSGLPKPVFLAIADESKKVGLPFAGHVPDAVTVVEASDTGLKSIEHLTGMTWACSSHEEALMKKEADLEGQHPKPAARTKAMRALRAEGLATYDDARCQRVFSKLVANGTWQVPTLTVLNAMATLDDPSHASDPRLAYVSGMMKAFWNPKRDFRTKDRSKDDYDSYRAMLAEQTKIVGAMNKAGVGILAGTDELNPYCFAGFSLHDELGYLVKAGLSPAEALRAATWSPARYLGWDAKMGTVAEGKVADLVVLDADPLTDIANTQKIAAVVTRGTFYDRKELDALLARTKSVADSEPAMPAGP